MNVYRDNFGSDDSEVYSNMEEVEKFPSDNEDTVLFKDTYKSKKNYAQPH